MPRNLLKYETNFIRLDGGYIEVNNGLKIHPCPSPSLPLSFLPSFFSHRPNVYLS